MSDTGVEVVTPAPAPPQVLRPDSVPVVPEVAAEVPAVEAVPAVETPAAPTLLSETETTPTPPEAATEAPPPVVEAPETTETPPVEEPPPAPTYEITWAEDITAPPADDPTFSSFVELAGANHLPQEAAQQLIDLHTAALRQVQESVTQRQFDVFAETVKGWEQDFRTDPAFANRVDTVLNDARWAIKEFAGSDTELAELRTVLLTSGLGNHKAVIRAFANVAKRFKEARPGPRPAPQTGQRGDPADRRYGQMTRTE